MCMDEQDAPIDRPPEVPAHKQDAPVVAATEPPRWTESIALAALVVLADIAIYRGDGYTGWALVLAVTPFLLCLGAVRRQLGPTLVLLGGMLLLTSARLIWCGTTMAVTVGTAVVPLFAMTLSGRPPYLIDGLWFAAAIVPCGGRGIAAYGRGGLSLGRRFAPAYAIVVVLPVAVGIAFSLLFLLANPDLVRSVSETLARWFDAIRDWLAQVSLGECAFVFGIAWIAVALLRPCLNRTTALVNGGSPPHGESQTEAAPRPVYLAWRNTLIVVIAVYAVYLVFEFQTLWFRQFPKGFYYAGYAHQGAAWLTIGLALATSILSLIFRGRILNDPRIGRLQHLAFLWSIENFLLAAAVYNRLLIYIRFNGLTHLRIVGLYGVSAVLVGFMLVLVMIIRRRNFGWLLQRHLWTLGIASYLYAISPVDVLAMQYNVSRVLAGDLPPSVQISVQPISVEGLLVLKPLLDCPNPIVREGVAALLSERLASLKALRVRHPHWTAYQMADDQLAAQFSEPAAAAKIHFKDFQSLRMELEKFRKYTFQWY